MNGYEKLLQQASDDDLLVIEKYDFAETRLKGLYCDGTVALDKRLATERERNCILAEELGHHHTTAGDILDQSSANNQKQELRARIWAYNRLIGLMGIVDCCKAQCQNSAEIAEHLGVTEEFLNEAMEYYKNKYGTHTTIDNYVIYFEPAVAVLEII